MAFSESRPQVTQKQERPRFDDDPIRRSILYEKCCQIHKAQLEKLPDKKAKAHYLASHIDKSFFEVVTGQFEKALGEWWSEDLIRFSALSDEVVKEITGDVWEGACLCIDSFLEKNKLFTQRDLSSAMFVNDMQERRRTTSIDGVDIMLTSERELSAIRYQLTLLRIQTLENGASISTADMEHTVQNAFLFSQLERDEPEGLSRLTFLVREMRSVFPMQPICRYVFNENKDLLEATETEKLMKLKGIWKNVFSLFLEVAARKELTVHPLGRSSAEAATRKVGPNIRNFIDQRSHQEVDRADSLLESQYAGQKQQLQKAANLAIMEYYDRFPALHELRTVFSKSAIDTFINTLRFEIATRTRDKQQLSSFDILYMTETAEALFGIEMLQHLFGNEHISKNPPIVRLTLLFYVCMGQNGFSFGNARPLIQQWEQFIRPHLTEYKDTSPPYQEKRTGTGPLYDFREKKYEKGYQRARDRWQNNVALLESKDCIRNEEAEEFKQLFDSAITQLAPSTDKLTTLIELQKAYPAERKKLIAALALLTSAVGGSIFLWQLDIKSDYLLLQYRVLAVIAAAFLPSFYLLNTYRRQRLIARYGSVRSLLTISPVQLNSLEYALEDMPRKDKKGLRKLASVSAATLAILLMLQLDISMPGSLDTLRTQVSQGVSAASRVGVGAAAAFFSDVGELASYLTDYLIALLPTQETSPSEKLTNNEKNNKMEDAQFTTYGSHSDLTWIDETGYLKPESASYQPIRLEEESKLPVMLLDSVTALRSEVLSQAQQGRIVRLNLDKENAAYGIPQGYRPSMILSTRSDVVQTTSSEIGLAVSFSSGRSGRTALVYEEDPSGMTQPQSFVDLPDTDLIPDQNWQKGALKWLQPLEEEARKLRKNGATARQILDHLKDGISHLGISYGYEEYLSTADVPEEELIDLFAFDSQGKPTKKEWICTQFSHALYILAREAGLDVRIANGAMQLTDDINGGYKARRHRFLLFREKPGDAYAFFEATLPSLTEPLLQEPQDVIDTQTEEDPLLNEARTEQNMHLAVNCLAGLGAFLAISGMAFYGVRRYRSYKQDQRDEAYSNRFDRLSKKLKENPPEVLTAAWRIIFACTIQSPLNSIYRGSHVAPRPVNFKPGKAMNYEGAAYRWFDFQKGSVVPSQEEAARIVDLALHSFSERRYTTHGEDLALSQHIDEMYAAFGAVASEERFARASRRKRFVKRMMKQFWQTNMGSPVTVTQSLQIASAAITKQIEMEESLSTKVKMQEVRSIIELLLPE